MSVATRPGLMTNNEMGVSSTSPATDSTSLITAALEAEYADAYGASSAPMPLPSTTMRPLPLGTIVCSAAHRASWGPRRLTSTSRHQSSGSLSQMGPAALNRPALATTRSSAP